MSALLTLSEFKSLLGEDPQPSDDDAGYELAIEAASEMVRNYTNLSFEIAAPNAAATARTYHYDGLGFLDIDECQSISSVSITGNYAGSTPNELTPQQWLRYPLNKPVALWLELPGSRFGGISPQMGFTYNLDTLYPELIARSRNITLVTVTAVWGWSAIPADVKQAVAWTATAVSKTADPYHQEAIADYSRTRVVSEVGDSLPQRAMNALDPYIIPRV